MAVKPCLACGALTSGGSYCALHNRNGSSTRWRKLRGFVLYRDKGVCWICGEPGANSVDHVTPRSAGGSDDPWNLRAAHLSCNVAKHDT